jgi:branched-chain amino acid aminotransferase
MKEASEIKVTQREGSGLEGFSLLNLPFGKYFTDHMLEAEYADGRWQTAEIKPYQTFQAAPSLSALHYGQAIFEGIKAFRNIQGKVSIFRPLENFKRFNRSAVRMQMPEVPESLFIDGMKKLIGIDSGWVPDFPEHSLYIRPFMFASDHFLGVRPSETYKFMIILSPSGPYFMEPQRIYVEEHYVRAVPGGVGFAKAAGNYGSSLYASAQARLKGYDQVLWMDPFEHKYVQEIGMMNVFFVIDDTVITPGLDEGTILEGVTRDSVIRLLRASGVPVEERLISIDEIICAYEQGRLREVFGAGTAATISFIKELGYKDRSVILDPSTFRISVNLKDTLAGIRAGTIADRHGWLMPV